MPVAVDDQSNLGVYLHKNANVGDQYFTVPQQAQRLAMLLAEQLLAHA